MTDMLEKSVIAVAIAVLVLSYGLAGPAASLAPAAQAQASFEGPDPLDSNATLSRR